MNPHHHKQGSNAASFAVIPAKAGTPGKQGPHTRKQPRCLSRAVTTTLTILFLVSCNLSLAAPAAADEWADLVTVSSTQGLNANRLCTAAPGHPTDIGCPTNAPYLDPSTGNLGIGTASPINVLDLGAATYGRGITWGGGGQGYSNIWSAYSSGALTLANGLRGGTTADDYYSATDLSTGRAMIRMAGINADGSGGTISFFTDDVSTVASNTLVTPTERMRITPEGNLGIGTSTPTQLLDVSGTKASQIHFSSDNVGGGYLTSTFDGFAGLSGGASYDGTNWVARSTGAGILFSGGQGIVGFTADSGLTPGTTFSPTVQVTINPSGGVGIGRAIAVTPSYPLDVSGTIRGTATATTGNNIGILGQATGSSGNNYAVLGQANGSTGANFGVYGQATATGYGVYCSSASINGCGGNHNWTTTSDARLKRDITTLDSSKGLAAIMKLRPVSFKWRTEDSGKTELGFIAQEVEPILPALVGNAPDTQITTDAGTKETITNVKALKYAQLVVPLVKAVQQQQAEIEKLQNNNNNLRARLSQLESGDK